MSLGQVMRPFVQKLEHLYFIFFLVYALYFDTVSVLFALELHHTVQLTIAVIYCHAMPCHGLFDVLLFSSGIQTAQCAIYFSCTLIFVANFAL